jgi:hypothetical protein
LINRDIWNLLDSNSRAGLLLHEIIYEHFVSEGEQNSRLARYFNSHLASTSLRAMTISQYVQFLKSMESEDSRPINEIWIGNFGFAFLADGSGISFYPSGQVRFGWLLNSVEVMIGSQVVTCKEDRAIEFHENGTVKKCWFE